MPRNALIPLVVACQLSIAVWTHAQSEEKKGTAGPGTAVDADAKVATVLGHDVFRRDVVPPATWYEERAKYLAKNGHTKGFHTEEEYRRQKISQLIWKPLIDEFGGKKDFEPTEEELHEFTRHYRESRRDRTQKDEKRVAELKAQAEKLERELPPPDRRQATDRIQTHLDSVRKEIQAVEAGVESNRKMDDEKQERFFVHWYVGNWKKQQWFYRRYGGRVIWQQVGFEAIDGMRDFLKEQETKGRFAIYDDKLKALFWEYYSKEKSHVFVPNPDKIFEHPWATLWQF